MNTIKIRKPVMNALIWVVPQVAAFAGGLSVAAWTASTVVHRVDDLAGLIITLLSAFAAWAVLGMGANDISKAMTRRHARKSPAGAVASAEAAYRDPSLFDLEIKDNALKTAEFRLAGVETDDEQIAAADAIYRWVADPTADRRVRAAAHRNLHNRITHDDKPTVTEFLKRAEAYEAFLGDREEWSARA